MPSPHKKTLPQYVWLKVTHDKYELPLCLADSAAELARKLGTSPQAVMSAVCHEKHGRCKSCYKKVRIDGV